MTAIILLACVPVAYVLHCTIVRPILKSLGVQL